MPEAYCPTCRRYFVVQATPPYAVIHVLGPQEIKMESVTVEASVHRHAITRELLEAVGWVVEE